MCANCMSNAEFFAANAAALAGAVVQAVRAAEPVDVRAARRLLRDAHTVSFLRGLDLDPVAALGAGVVERADDTVRVAGAARIVAARRHQGGLGVIRSQRRLALQ